MREILQVNVIGSALLAIQAFSLLGLAQKDNRKPHQKGFLLFWGLGCFIVLVFYLMRAARLEPPIWLELALDTANIFAFGLAAYVLFRGDQFAWRDQPLVIALMVFPAVALLEVLIGVLVVNEGRLWKAFYTATNAFMSTAVVFLIGFGLFREPATRIVRWPLMIIFCVYALIQIPSYDVAYVFVDPHATDEERATMRTFTGVGKIALLLAFTAAALSARGERNPERFLRWVKILVWFLSLGFAGFILFYRVVQVLQLP